MNRWCLPVAGILATIFCVPCSLVGQAPLTLEQAIKEAQVANAQLPISLADSTIAAAGIRGARGQLWPSLGIGGDLHDGTPDAYAGGDAALQLVSDFSIYDGGELRAGVGESRAHTLSAGARYRAALGDLKLEVTTSFSELAEIEGELDVRRAAIARLESYLSAIEARKASGQAVASDLLRTRVTLGGERAGLSETERRRDAARMELNDLIGRAPDSTLTLAPLPVPIAPRAEGGRRPWETVPDVQEASAEKAAALFGVRSARAGRLPHLSLSTDAGVLPLLGGDTGTGINNGTGWGAELTLFVSWPLWDRGIYRARMEGAELEADRAGRVELAAQRRARLEWQRATSDLSSLYDQVQIWSGSRDAARDSYLQAESLYRGGAATALEVLDAYHSWVDAGIASADATFQYRIAEARLQRWGGP